MAPRSHAGSADAETTGPAMHGHNERFFDTDHLSSNHLDSNVYILAGLAS